MAPWTTKLNRAFSACQYFYSFVGRCPTLKLHRAFGAKTEIGWKAVERAAVAVNARHTGLKPGLNA